MVTEAGKELLRNTINTANFHNKILEENEMWKQWELERGLTMMVSDDDVLKRIRKHHRCAKHQKMEDIKERKSFKNLGLSNSEAGPSKSESDRWDHSGYLELYPDETTDKKPLPVVKEHLKKHKEKKKKKHHSSVPSDDEIYQEFKEYKRRRRSEKERSKLTPTKSREMDNHVKEWKKRKEKYQ